MQKVINTFEGGLDMDSPLNSRENNTCLHAENAYITIDSADNNIPSSDFTLSSKFSITIVKGNTLRAELNFGPFGSVRPHGQNSAIQLGNFLYIICKKVSNSTCFIVRYTIVNSGN